MARTASIFKRALQIALLATAIATLAGCYTLFRHPRVAQYGYARPPDQACRTCHTTAKLWSLTHPTGAPALRGEWREFYDTPWWTESRWGTADGDPESPVPGGERDAD